jgi:hypothetical protein
LAFVRIDGTQSDFIFDFNQWWKILNGNVFNKMALCGLIRQESAVIA